MKNRSKLRVLFLIFIFSTSIFTLIYINNITIFTNSSENDLLNIPSQYLSYTVYQRETCDEKIVTYSNRDFGACGHIYVDDCAHPTIKSSNVVNNFYELDGVWVAGNDELTKITAMPKINKNQH